MRETSNILLDTYEASNKTSWLTTYNENLEKVDNFAGTVNTRIQQNETNITTINNDIELIKTNIATLSEEGTGNTSSISQLQSSINDLNVNVEANTAKNNLQDQNISNNLNKINDLQATTEGQYSTLLNQVTENTDNINVLTSSALKPITVTTSDNNFKINTAYFTKIRQNLFNIIIYCNFIPKNYMEKRITITANEFYFPSRFVSTGAINYTRTAGGANYILGTIFMHFERSSNNDIDLYINCSSNLSTIDGSMTLGFQSYLTL